MAAMTVEFIAAKDETLNPILSRLGYAPTDRVVVIHADDVSMCQSSLNAFVDLLDCGLVSSGSLMVPCPWFPATAKFCRENPEIDMGVHITLNCEWQDYRWGPISTNDPASGLVDADGYSPMAVDEIWDHANSLAAIHEAQSQLARALASGVDVTHLDEHMGAILHPRLLPAYTDFILQQRIPVRWLNSPEPSSGHEWAYTVWQQHQRIAEAAFPLFDFDASLPLHQPHGQSEMLRVILGQLPPGGLSLIVAHPAKDTPELRAIAPDWPSRVANYEAFSCPETRQLARDQGIQIIGFRPLRELLRGA
jgi:predicted glycoside hydrolase/deacetylase ChbG (UPF0249 family)